MSTYAAPIRDMKFAVKELIGLDDIAGLPGCEDLTPDVVDAVLEEAGKFATGVLDPLNRKGDTTGAKLNNNVVTSAPGFAEAFKQFSQGGWTGLNCDPQYGGQGLPHIISAQTSEMWNSANMSFCLCPMLTAGVVASLMRHGSDAQKDTYLPNLVERQMDRDHESHRTAGGFGSFRCAHSSRARGQPFPDPRHQDLHHLGRARHGGEHHPHGARAHARCAGRRERHFAFRRAEIPGQRRRQPGKTQRREMRVDRAQARHPRQPDLRDGLRRRRRCGRLPGRRGESRPGIHVHDDEFRAA